MSSLPERATIDVVVQVFILALLIASIAMLRMNRDLKAHGSLLAVATLVNLGAIIIRMVPALLGDIETPFVTLTPHFVGEIVHIGVGAIAEVLALYITLRWAVHRFDPKGCFAKGFMGKGLMNLTFATWLIALALGIILYANDLMSG